MIKVIVGVMMMMWRKMRMTITSVWVVGVVPKAAVVQDEVEGTPIVVSMRQKIFPEKKISKRLCGQFPGMPKANCVEHFKKVFKLTMNSSIFLIWQLN